MTSENGSFPQRLTKIDDLTRPDHHYLRDSDQCFFLGEYTARKGFSHSETNNLIINFKKPMDRRGTTQWKYKGIMIRRAAAALYHAIGGTNLREFIFVPVPPSKISSDPLYDDRMVQMLNGFSNHVNANYGYRLEVREIVTQSTSTAAAHDGDVRPSPETLASLYCVDTSAIQVNSPTVVICDDVLTTGCHYRAMVLAISRELPASSFRGVFLARRAPEAMDFSDVDIVL